MPTHPELKPRSDRGAVSTEYALLAIFIAVAAVIGITLLGIAADHLFQLGPRAIQTDGPK